MFDLIVPALLPWQKICEKYKRKKCGNLFIYFSFDERYTRVTRCVLRSF